MSTVARSGRQILRRLVVQIGLGVLAACGGWLEPIELQHDPATGLEQLEVTCASREELSGQPAFVISVVHHGKEELREVELVLDDTHRAPLASLQVVGGFFSGASALGRSTIHPADKLVFVFSHDVPNGWFLRDEADQPFQQRTLPASITLTSGARSGRWVRTR